MVSEVPNVHEWCAERTRAMQSAPRKALALPTGTMRDNAGTKTDCCVRIDPYRHGQARARAERKDYQCGDE